MTQNKKGFTLIELMVVMAIIAVLAVLMIGAIQLARSTATETSHRSNGKTIQTALESTYAKYKMYCGGTSGVTCTVGTATTPFDTIDGQLLVSLNTSSTAGSCASSNAGGGRVSVTGTTYKIIPVNSSCSGTGSTTTVVAGDLDSDIYEVK
jgi:prepilin-type N-terminal cleavage/methylation domain-containing protein